MEKSTPPSLPRVIAIVGPTASGKTRLAINLARRFNGEIVSADSRQIYRGMNIGTAKPSNDELAAIPHHLIDIKNPDEEYSVADYKKDAIAAMQVIIQKNKLPFLVGGTGLYVNAVIQNLDIPEVKADPQLRARLEKEIKANGLPAVFQKLVALDPDAETLVDAKNPRRVVRALEVALATGKPFTAQRNKNEPTVSALVLGLHPEETVLRERINARAEAMIKNGLVPEVENLLQHYGENRTAFDSIGYREVIEFKKGVITLEEAAVKIKMNTWHYAKRQMTWFKKDPTIHWIENEDPAARAIEDFLQ